MCTYTYLVIKGASRPVTVQNKGWNTMQEHIVAGRAKFKIEEEREWENRRKKKETNK